MILILSGCGTFHYLLQAGQGQLALVNHSRPIPEVLNDEKTSPKTKALLREIPSMKSFIEARGLKPTQNYTEFVNLNRSAAVWVVSACEPLRFQSKEWKFPIVGSFPYLGWFDLKSAQNFAKDLENEGWDVNLRGASAFSTLGWFKDPILSTMLSSGEGALGDLTDVVIHESVHATLYLNGQSYFNESVASFIAENLTPIYLDQILGENSSQRKTYLDHKKKSAEFEKKYHSAYQELAKLYQSSNPDEEKKKIKNEIISRLTADLASPRGRVNNATLIQFKTYRTGKEDFSNLLKRCGSNWNRFLASLKTLRPESFPNHQQEDFSEVLLSLTCSD